MGELRWKKPQPPGKETGIQDGTYGPHCIQAKTNYGKSYENMTASEDCLFLDLYLPGKVLRDSKVRLPVVVWVFGGSYSEFTSLSTAANMSVVAGSKDIR